MGKEWLSTEIAEITEDGYRRTEDLILTTDEEGMEGSFIRDICAIRGQLREAQVLFPG